MRLIDADAFLESEIKRCGRVPIIGSCTADNEIFKFVLERQPTIESVPVHGNKMQDFNNDLIRRTDALNMVHNFFLAKIKAVSGDREEIPMGELDQYLKDNKELAAKIKSIPNFEAAPVVHGEWIDAEQYVNEDGLRYTQVRCSLCGRYEDEREPYCNCGADMRKEKEVMPAKFNEDGCPFDCPCLDDYPDCYCNAEMDRKAV